MLRTLLLLSLVVFAAPGLVDAADRTITVTGAGEIHARPSVVELVGIVKGDAELAEDAVVKYRDNRRRAVEAIEALAIDGLTIVGGGVSIKSGTEGDAQAAMLGRAMTVGSQKLAVTEPLTIRIEGIEKLSTEELIGILVRIVDAGKDAGVQIGGRQPSYLELQMGVPAEQTLATFRLSQADGLQKEAYRAAVENARAQAEQLAELAGVRLGPVVKIDDATRPAGESNEETPRDYWSLLYSLSNSPNSKEGYSSQELAEIPVRAVLRISFAIE